MRRFLLSQLDRLALIAFALLCYWTADRTGAFWWFDSAGHALNGVLLHDFFGDLGFINPLTFALNFYARLPGVTLGFYPPGFAFLQLPFYALMGVSGASAQACMSACSLGLGIGTAELGRALGWRRWPAAAAGLASMAFPEMLLWSRQIQPEIPAIAGLVWSFAALLRWRRSGRVGHLRWAAGLFLASLYVKQTGLFLAPLVLVAVAIEYVRWPERRRDIRMTALAFIVGCLPLLGLSIAFGGFNLRQSLSAPEEHFATYYLRVLPDQIGWPALTLSIVGLICLVLISRRQREPILILGGWFCMGLLFFSLIALKSPRFTTVLLPVVALAAAYPFNLFRIDRRILDSAAMGLALTLALTSIASVPARRYEGFAEASRLVAERAPQGSSTLLLAHRSGNFLFALRADQNREDLRIVRAEQAYVSYSVSKAFGATDGGIDAARIRADLDQWNVSLLVIQRGMWSDLPSIAALHALLGSPEFRLIGSAPLAAVGADPDRAMLDIYQRLDYAHRPTAPRRVKIPLIGVEITLPDG